MKILNNFSYFDIKTADITCSCISLSSIILYPFNGGDLNVGYKI